MGIAKFYKLSPEIYYHWVLSRDGYCPLCPVILYIAFDCDRYYLVYVTLCFCVSLTLAHHLEFGRQWKVIIFHIYFVNRRVCIFNTKNLYRTNT
jgi:hypothetical protein